MTIRIEHLLTLYAIGSAVTHTAMAGQWFITKARSERSAIIAKHVKSAHRSALKHCREAECVKLGYGTQTVVAGQHQ